MSNAVPGSSNVLPASLSTLPPELKALIVEKIAEVDVDEDDEDYDEEVEGEEEDEAHDCSSHAPGEHGHAHAHAHGSGHEEHAHGEEGEDGVVHKPDGSCCAPTESPMSAISRVNMEFAALAQPYLWQVGCLTSCAGCFPADAQLCHRKST